MSLLYTKEGYIFAKNILKLECPMLLGWKKAVRMTPEITFFNPNLSTLYINQSIMQQLFAFFHGHSVYIQ